MKKRLGSYLISAARFEMKIILNSSITSLLAPLKQKPFPRRFKLSILSIIALLCYSCSSQTSPGRNKLIKVLIVDGFSNHDWKKTSAVVKGRLERSGIVSVDVSTYPINEEKIKQWRPQFKNYDVVIQNCNDINGGPQWPRQVQKDLEAFVAQGGGLYILHSANNAFAEWPEYNKMIGLGWRSKNFGPAISIDSHGHSHHIPTGKGDDTGHGHRVNALLTRLGEHPIHRGLPRQWMAADLEIYRYARGPAKNLSVLSYARDQKTNKNFPVEWVVNYGKGRVYNSTFGHHWSNQKDPAGMRCVAFRTLMLRAVEWLAGREVKSTVPAKFPTAQKIQLKAKGNTQ